MIAAISDAEAAVVGSCLVFALGIAGLYVQNRRGITSQRGDHAATAAKVDQLVVEAAEAREDRREMKADIRDIKDEQRSTVGRLTNLERMVITQDHTDRVVSDNNRKLQAIQEHKEQAS